MKKCSFLAVVVFVAALALVAACRTTTWETTVGNVTATAAWPDLPADVWAKMTPKAIQALAEATARSAQVAITVYGVQESAQGKEVGLTSDVLRNAARGVLRDANLEYKPGQEPGGGT